VVSVVGNFAADLDSANTVQRTLLPLVDAVMHASRGAVMAKAALAWLGILCW
jgi:4-hydroxy-tetrahydrodipicolinate synthase